MLKTILSHDFRHTAINQLWRLISGPLVLILIPLYLTPEIQGYWYTFTSLAALAVFADLGFTTIILQFSAHEFAYLSFDENKRIIGDQKYLERLSSLFRFAMGWSVKIAFVAFPLISIIGYCVLVQKESTHLWLIPWLIYSLASLLFFLNNIILSFIEGCNSVGDAQKIRFFMSVVNIGLMSTLLVSDEGLFALAVSMLISSLFGTSVIYIKYSLMLKQLIEYGRDIVHSWSKDILPLLGKYAISWASGYFIFSIFTPLAFHYYGAVEAGKVGISIALWTAIYGISNIWITIIIPKINMYVSKSDYNSLNNIFYKHLFMSIGTFILAIVAVFLIYYLLNLWNYSIIDRFVSPLSLSILAFAWLMQVIINALAVYMRAHKEEPLVIPSFLSGIYISLITFVIASNHLPFEYYFLGFLSSYIWGFPWVWKIFKRYKKDELGSK